ncbi:MAG: zinc uptake regulator [Candidatus Tokpelaia sp. JSC189]|nr:MAG: zinc uptake regulator [Candidatus Tokpelaia sp. JSC189]
MLCYDILTRNQRHVLDLLLAEKTALSAYTILDRLRIKGFRAPLQVYRALEKLIKLGLVHRLESLNAFIACSRPECEEHSLIAFVICRKCSNIIEFDNGVIDDNVKKHMQTINFWPQDTILEIRGICAGCHSFV